MPPPKDATAGLEPTLQWMMAAITSPGGLPQGLMRAGQINDWAINDVVAVPSGVAPHSRLDIYARGYWLRLLDCLSADYPTLQRLLGEPLFEFFARRYLDQHPSQSFSLYGLGDRFPAFLRRSQSAAARAEGGAALRFPLELARIEQAIAVAVRAQGPEGDAPVSMDPAHLLLADGISIELPATTRLLLTRFPRTAFQPWLNGGTTDAPPTPGIGFLAVKRQRFRVSCEALSDWQFYGLAAARQQRRSLLSCVECAARRTKRPVPELLAKLAFWLPTAQAAGLVRLSVAPFGGTPAVARESIGAGNHETHA